MGEASNEELMSRFCTGDSAAFRTLFGRLGPMVQRFLRSMLREPTLVEDVTQTTFLSVVRSRDRYTPGADVARWVLSIAANAARDLLRHRALGVEQLSSTGDAVERPSQAPLPDPGLRRRLEDALQALPESQREVVVLHKVEGLTFEEVAGVLGITSTAARIRAHRGYGRLKELLVDLEGM